MGTIFVLAACFVAQLAVALWVLGNMRENARLREKYPDARGFWWLRWLWVGLLCLCLGFAGWDIAWIVYLWRG